MPLFYLKYSLLDNTRSDCMILFGGMDADDDKRDTGDDINILGRWSTVGEASGYCICEAKDAKSLNKWLMNWITMATIVVHPILDDNSARKIILGKEPPFAFDYSNVAKEADVDESLYFIEYKFLDGKREKGFEAFANMTEKDDKIDAGNNICLGRWHNLGNGSGVAICLSKSETDLYSWAYNWTSMCDCIIRPVVSDTEFRDNMQIKPGFFSKYQTLIDKLKEPKKTWWR